MPGESGFEVMKGLLQSEEQRLRLELEDIRRKYNHPGNKGGIAEQIFREFLGRYLPLYNRVGHGEVFNIDGLRSRQTDVVITNEYHVGLRSDWTEAQTFTLESVECAGEVKSIIKDRATLRDFFDKAQAFKSMPIEPDQGMQFRAQNEDVRRFIWRKPFFGFAFESDLSIDRIIQELRAWDNELRPIERPVLDTLFILDRGGTMHMGDGGGGLRSLGGDGEPQKAYTRSGHGGAQVLTDLLLWIYATMPRIQYYTHPAFVYLRPNPHKGRLILSDDGTLTRKIDPTAGSSLPA